MEKLIYIILVSVSIILLFLGCSNDEDPGGSADTHGLQMLEPNKTLETNIEPRVTFIELGSNECIPCKMMKSVMKAIEVEFGDQVKVVFYDVWKDQAPAKKYDITLIPTQVFLDESGEEFFRHEGYFPKEEVETLLLNRGLTLLKKVEIEKYEEK